MTLPITLKKFVPQDDEPTTDRNFIVSGLREVQNQHRHWVDHNFPNGDREQALLKLIEETGELAHAIYDMKTGTRDSHPKAFGLAADAIGDIFISLVGAASVLGIDFQDALKTEWDKVIYRDWQRCPVDGVTPREKPEKPKKPEMTGHPEVVRRNTYVPES